MTHLERLARAIEPEAWADVTQGIGPDIVTIHRLASLQKARRAIGTMRMTGARTCGMCDGQPECACIEAVDFSSCQPLPRQDQ